MTLFNPLTRSETPADEEATPDKNQSQKISPAGTNQLHGNKQPSDTQSAARLKLLDSLNNNVPPPTSKTWNSPVNSYASQEYVVNGHVTGGYFTEEAQANRAAASTRQSF